jgi:serine protease AprX
VKTTKYITFTVCFFFFLWAHAEEGNGIKKPYPEGKCYMYRIILKDKADSPYSISRPKEFLSIKSINRRIRQGIAIDSTDLPVLPNYINTIKEYGVRIIGTSKWNNTVLVRTDKLSSIELIKQLNFVKKLIRVWSSPDSIDIPQPRMRCHYGFNKWDTIPEKKYGATEEQIYALNGIKLHDAGFYGKDITIAVLDGGFMNADIIPAFSKTDIVGSKDFVFPPSKSIFEETDHGTKVLSDMAAYVPNVFIGTSHKASYWLIRCEDKQTESLAEEDYWAEAAEFSDSVGVDIINSSLGYNEFDDITTNHRYREMDGEKTLISHTASMLADKGIILINSAGNTGMGTWKKIAFPADAKNILCVGAIGKNLINAPFSGIGPTQDGRIKPDVMSVGSPAAVITGRGTLILDTGTSFSAPILCGLVACLWQALPQLNAFQIMNLVKKSSNNYNEPDNIYGYGIPDFWKAYTEGSKECQKQNTK